MHRHPPAPDRTWSSIGASALQGMYNNNRHKKFSKINQLLNIWLFLHIYFVGSPRYIQYIQHLTSSEIFLKLNLFLTFGLLCLCSPTADMDDICFIDQIIWIKCKQQWGIGRCLLENFCKLNNVIHAWSFDVFLMYTYGSMHPTVGYCEVFAGIFLQIE